MTKLMANVTTGMFALPKKDCQRSCFSHMTLSVTPLQHILKFGVGLDLFLYYARNIAAVNSQA